MIKFSNVSEKKEHYLKDWDRLVYTILALAVLLFTWLYGNTQPFNSDELVQISTSKFFARVIPACASGVDLTPPLFGFVFSLWYRIAPYGEKWLYLFPGFFVSGSIFLIGVIGARLQNVRVGVLACFLAATSTTIFQIAFEIRSYAFLLFFSTLSFLIYIRRSEYFLNMSGKAIFMFGISLAFVAYSHYYGLFICMGYFIADFFLCIKNRIKVYAIFSYVIAGILFLPWLIYFLIHKYDVSSWFPERRANISDALQVFRYLTGNLNILLIVFIVGSLLVVLKSFLSKYTKQSFELKDFFAIFSVCMVWGFILFFYAYGAFVDPHYNIFKNRILIERYYCGLFPFAIFICALALDYLYGKNKMFRYAYILLAGFLIINVYQVIPNLPQDPNRNTANWLLSQSDIYSPETILLSLDDDYGFQEYYITRQGRREPVNAITQWNISKEILENAQTVYLYASWSLPNPEQLVNEKEEFLRLYELKETRDDLRIKVFERKR